MRRPTRAQRAFDAARTRQLPRQAAERQVLGREFECEASASALPCPGAMRPESGAPATVALIGARRPRASACKLSFVSRSLTGSPSQRLDAQLQVQVQRHEVAQRHGLPRRRSRPAALRLACDASAASQGLRSSTATLKSPLRRGRAPPKPSASCPENSDSPSLPCSWLSAMASALATTAPLSAATPTCGSLAPSSRPSLRQIVGIGVEAQARFALASVEFAVGVQPGAGSLEGRA